MPTLVRIEANVPWQIASTKSGYWIGVCEPLKLTVQSEAFSDLMEDIGITLDAILKDLLASNELPQFLKDRGWQLMSAIPDRSDDVRFDVPFIPVRTMPHGPQAELYQLNQGIEV